MKRLLNTFFFLSGIISAAFAQNPWTWMHGSNNNVNLPPVYGTLSIPASTNTPGGRCGSACWTDTNNDLWLYGGIIYGSSPNPCTADLWKYNTITNEWAWMGGPNVGNATPVYGTMGVPSTTNNPGARMNMCTWKSANGDFWLYGGYIYVSNIPTFFGDLWRYRPSTSEWTWMSGTTALNASPVFGTLTISSAGNMPGGRCASMGIIDNSGSFWLFGGQVASTGARADTWKYDPSTSLWACMNGSNTANLNPAYGPPGVANATTTPGSRGFGLPFKDNSGNFWLFGGTGQNGYMGDLWRYDYSGNNWAWMSGMGSGSYGTLSVPTATNTPPNRWWAGYGSTSDNGGSLWLFGGYGYVTNLAGVQFSDTWRYIPSTGLWIWDNGSSSPNQPGNYGLYQANTPGSNPGARYGQCVWKDNSGNFWIYGGEGRSYLTTVSGYLNDIWRYKGCQSLPAPANSTPSAGLVICSGASSTLSALSGSSAISWYASPTSSAPLASNSATYVTPALSAPATPSAYTFYAETSSTCGASYVRTPVTLTVNPVPQLTVASGSLCIGSTYTIVASGAVSYTFSGGSAVVSPTGNATYSVTGANSFGCVSPPVTCTISILPLPTITVNSGQVCSGQNFSIQPSGASTYTYPGGLAVVNPTTGTSYSVTGSDANGCTAAQPAVCNVTVLPLPALVLTTSGSTLCAGESATLSCTGALTYTWSTGTNAASDTISPLFTSSYSLSATGSNGCINTASITQQVDACLGMEKEKPLTSATRIFPNPGSGVFIIETGLPASLAVYNSVGQLLFKQHLIAGPQQLSLPGYPKGIYLLKVLHRDGHIETTRLILD